MATWDDVRVIATALPEVVEHAPNDFRVQKKLVAWERPLRKADLDALGSAAPNGDILGVWVPSLDANEIGDVVAGWKNKLQSAIASVTPAALLAEQHRKQTEPGSGAR